MLRQLDADSTVEIEGTETPSRRGFLGTLTKAALGIVAGAAYLTRGSAWAHGYHYGCCHLAKPHSGGYCAYNCWKLASSGYRERYWTCLEGASTVYTCFECTTGDTCWQGSFYCSDYWVN